MLPLAISCHKLCFHFSPVFFVRLASWWRWRSPSQPRPSCRISGAKNGRLSSSRCRFVHADRPGSQSWDYLYHVYKSYHFCFMFEWNVWACAYSFTDHLSLGDGTFPPCGCSLTHGDSRLANSFALLSHEQERWARWRVFIFIVRQFTSHLHNWRVILFADHISRNVHIGRMLIF